VPLAIMFMPEHWTSRMHTIQTYEEDASAMGRINAWWFAFNLAKDRPIVGGGFETFRGWIFARWAPDPGNYHDAHSIYFEVLGEHGFVGLALFLALGLMSLRLAGQVARLARKDTALQWMTDLASLLQVSLIGYATAGLFLGLAYFDFYYALVAAVVGCKVVLERHQHSSRSAEVATGAKRRETISAPLAPGAGRRLSSPRP
jgi:probable O-glycosylation ligase (exosortase A-associated)